jgi:hypothetical protein
MNFLLTLWQVLSQALILWVKAHPMTAWALLLAEVVISAIASKLTMPTEKDSTAYHVIFILFTALAINHERVRAAVAILRGNGKLAVPSTDNPAPGTGTSKDIW